MEAFIEVRMRNEVLHVKKLNGAKVSIGRDYHNALYLHDDNISRLHGVIGYEMGQYYYEDFSSNGTLLNNKKIRRKKMFLNHGDLLCLSNYEIIFSAVPIAKEGSYDFRTKTEMIRSGNLHTDGFYLVEMKSGRKSRILNHYFTIGSHPENHLVINDNSVAGHHVSIYLCNGLPHLESFDDRTFLNDRQIRPGHGRLVLRDEDCLRLTDVKFRFNIKYKKSEKYGIITCSPIMKELINDTEVMAKTDQPILILGETGTGKELFSLKLSTRLCRQMFLSSLTFPGQS